MSVVGGGEVGTVKKNQLIEILALLDLPQSNNERYLTIKDDSSLFIDVSRVDSKLDSI